eukprot:scaffold5135_cov63-Phaeocystis_antarctica.AAC.1
MRCPAYQARAAYHLDRGPIMVPRAQGPLPAQFRQRHRRGDCVVRSLHLTAVAPPPLTDTLLPAQVQSSGRASLLTLVLARGESGNVRHRAGEPGRPAVGAGAHTRHAAAAMGLAHVGCSAIFGESGGRSILI